MGAAPRVNLRHRGSIDDGLVWERRGRRFDLGNWSSNSGMICALALRVCSIARTGSSYQPKSENSASRATYRFLVLIQSLFLEELYVYYPTMAFSVGLMVLLAQETSPTPDAIALDDGVSNAKSGGSQRTMTPHTSLYYYGSYLVFNLIVCSDHDFMACKMLHITCRTWNIHEYHRSQFETLLLFQNSPSIFQGKQV